MTSQWPRRRLKSPASWLSTQSFIRAQIKKRKKNIKAPSHWPLCGKFTGLFWGLARKCDNRIFRIYFSRNLEITTCLSKNDFKMPRIFVISKAVKLDFITPFTTLCVIFKFRFKSHIKNMFWYIYFVFWNLWGLARLFLLQPRDTI